MEESWYGIVAAHVNERGNNWFSYSLEVNIKYSVKCLKTIRQKENKLRTSQITDQSFALQQPKNRMTFKLNLSYWWIEPLLPLKMMSFYTCLKGPSYVFSNSAHRLVWQLSYCFNKAACVWLSDGTKVRLVGDAWSHVYYLICVLSLYLALQRSSDLHFLYRLSTDTVEQNVGHRGHLGWKKRSCFRLKHFTCFCWGWGARRKSKRRKCNRAGWEQSRRGHWEWK